MNDKRIVVGNRENIYSIQRLRSVNAPPLQIQSFCCDFECSYVDCCITEQMPPIRACQDSFVLSNAE